MEELVSRHKEAHAKRKRAEEQVKESYDALYSGIVEEAAREVKEKGGDSLKTLVLKPEEKRNWSVTMTFVDGVVVDIDGTRVTFTIGDGFEPILLNAFHLKSYKDKKKIPRERVNKHLPAVKKVYEESKYLSVWHLKQKIAKLSEE